MTMDEWEKQPLEEKKGLVQIGLGRVQAGAELAEERMKLNRALDDDETDDKEEIITREKRVVTIATPEQTVFIPELVMLLETLIIPDLVTFLKKVLIVFITNA